MSHRIYGPPSHELDRVEFVLHLPTRATNYHSRVTAHGYSATKRSTLWSSTEQWTWAEANRGYTPVDVLAHVALVAIQERPITQAGLEDGLRGGNSAAEQDPLF